MMTWARGKKRQHNTYFKIHINQIYTVSYKKSEIKLMMMKNASLSSCLTILQPVSVSSLSRGTWRDKHFLWASPSLSPVNRKKSTRSDARTHTYTHTVTCSTLFICLYENFHSHNVFSSLFPCPITSELNTWCQTLTKRQL